MTLKGRGVFPPTVPCLGKREGFHENFKLPGLIMYVLRSVGKNRETHSPIRTQRNRKVSSRKGLMNYKKEESYNFHK